MRTIIIVNELNIFVYDILAQRILAGLSKLKPQVLSSLTINYQTIIYLRSILLCGAISIYVIYWTVKSLNKAHKKGGEPDRSALLNSPAFVQLMSTYAGLLIILFNQETVSQIPRLVFSSRDKTDSNSTRSIFIPITPYSFSRFSE